MSITEKFTEALVKEEMQSKGFKRGYRVKTTQEVYDDYLQDDPQCQDTSWKQLRNHMDKKHVAQYKKGSGGELEEKDGKPPKMAAFASSSRMIYTLFAPKIEDVDFEEQLPTTIAGVANMDGYLKNAGKYTFVEAKCREPYNHSVKQAIKRNYHDVYDHLRKMMPRVFNCVMENIPDAENGKEPQNKMNVVFFCHNKVVAYFDIKQMISHLLGVATKFLESNAALVSEVEKLQFLYLLYNPSDLTMEAEDKAAVMAVYNDTCWCARHYHFEEMFGHIVDFLVPELCPKADKVLLQALKDAFHFDLCDQHSYMEYFK